MDADSSTGLNEDSESGECDSPSEDENTNNTIDFDSTSKLSANSERTNIDALDDTARDTLIVPPNFDDSSHSVKSLTKRSSEHGLRGDHDHDVLDFEGDDMEDNLRNSSDGRNAKILNNLNDDDDEEGELEEEDDDGEKSEKSRDQSTTSMSPGPALEEGECADDIKPKSDKGRRKIVYREDSDKDVDEGEDDELEEGEVTDDEDRNNKDPKPVCRFFGKGQCTWGSNCRFLHPGVTDTGLYTMFDTMRPLLPIPSNPASVKPGLLGIAPPNFPPIVKPEEPVVESAWERGLRHAKEIIKQSVKRKETDIDFEEKKMNLTLAQEEIDKENDYYVRKPESPQRAVVPAEDDPYLEGYDPPARWTASQGPADVPPTVVRHTVTPQKIDPDFVRERVHRIHKAPASSREAPAGRSRWREAPPLHEPEVRMVRESALRRGRNFPDPYAMGGGSSHGGSHRNYDDPRKAEEWHDPWMRSKSPSGRTRKDSSVSKRSSYSSGSSRSSSRSSKSSQQSSSSSRSSSQSSKSSRGSKSPAVKKRRRSREEVRKAPPRRISPKPMRIAPPPPPKEEFGRRIPSGSYTGGGPPPHFERPTRFAPSPPKIPGHLKDRLPEKNNLPQSLVRERDLNIRGGNHKMRWSSRSSRSRSSRSSASSRRSSSSRRDEARQRSPKTARSRSRDSRSRYKSRSTSRSRSPTKAKSNKRSKFSRDKSNSGSDRSLSRRASSSRSRSSSSSSSSSSLGSLPKASRAKRRVPTDIDKPEVIAVESTIREHVPPRAPQIKKVDPAKGQAAKSQIKMTLKGSNKIKNNKNVLDRLADDLQAGDRGSKDGGDRTPVAQDESSREALSVDEDVGSNDAAKGTSPKDSKQATKRREELLKQLKAVEDAIAKKRSKLERL